MNGRPVGVPFGHHSLEVDELYEDVLPTRGLSGDQVWVAPGLLYMVTGLDRSIFEMFSAASGKPLKVPTHRTPQALLAAEAGRPSQNAWAYTVQGIDRALWPAFRDYVASYGFRRPGADTWTAGWTEASILDPFWSGDPRWVEVHAITVRSLATGRHLTVRGPTPLHPSSSLIVTAVRDLTP